MVSRGVAFGLSMTVRAVHCDLLLQDSDCVQCAAVKGFDDQEAEGMHS